MDRSRPGFEEIPLDLSRIPNVEDGLGQAAERYRRFGELAHWSLGPSNSKLLLVSHVPLMSLINRASSLHAGVVSAVREQNPHAAFTLLRAYLELVALVFYVDAHPQYLAALERPMAELPKNTRKSFADLFEFAATELIGIRTVYALLNEMAHFGSTALWHPFSLDEKEPVPGTLGRLSFSTGPHWKNPDDARTALAMLAESDEASLEVLHRYATHHVMPGVARQAKYDRQDGS
jgi:hypothetical protein